MADSPVRPMSSPPVTSVCEGVEVGVGAEGGKGRVDPYILKPLGPFFGATTSRSIEPGIEFVPHGWTKTHPVVVGLEGWRGRNSPSRFNRKSGVWVFLLFLDSWTSARASILAYLVPFSISKVVCLHRVSHAKCSVV